jgi:hypothetical protein
VDRIEPEAVWLVRPCAADSFIGCKAAQGLKAPGEVVGVTEGREMIFELPLLPVKAPAGRSLPSVAMRDAMPPAGSVDGTRYLAVGPGG